MTDEEGSGRRDGESIDRRRSAEMQTKHASSEGEGVNGTAGGYINVRQCVARRKPGFPG